MRHALILALLCLIAAPVAADDPAQPFLHLKRGPYVQRVTPTDAVVCWRTLGKSKPALRYGAAPDKLDHLITGEKIDWGASSNAEMKLEPGVFITGPMIRAYRGQISDTGGTYHYEAHLTGLAPRTTIYYAVYHDGKLIGGGTPAHYVRTGSPGSHTAPVRLWAVGDSGTGGLAQRLVFGGMRQRVAKDKRPVDAILQIGGMAVGTSRGHLGMTRIFGPYGDLLRNTPMYPTPAADDVWPVVTDFFVLPAQGECGGVPSGSELYYAFEIGRAHCVAVASRFQRWKPEDQAAMLAWVKKDLAAARAAKEIDWLIVYFHDAPFAEFKERRTVLPNKVKSDLMPVLEAAGVDLILYAGTGNYQRTAPDARPMQVAVGNGGVPLAEAEPAEGMAVCLAEHGSLLIDIGANGLSAAMIDTAGETRDRFELKK